MANNLTGLIPIIYASLNTVSRELIGFIPAVSMDSNIAARAAVGQTVRSPVAPVSVTTDVNPSMSIPEGDDQDISFVDMTITHSKAVQIPFPGEEALSISTQGIGESIFEQQMKQAFRKLSGMVESSLAAHYTKASRAFGKPGTVPFHKGVGDAAQIRKLLVDNGAAGDLRLVLGTSAGANIRTNFQLTSASDAGTDATLRKGNLLELSGITLHESGMVGNHTVGNASNWLANGAFAKGATAIAKDGGAGEFVPGDLIAYDTGKFNVVGSSVPAQVDINPNGIALPLADNAPITASADGYEACMAFQKDAIVLTTRAPDLPTQGDAARDRMTVVDPVSGLGFEISVYVGYKKVMLEIAIAWGSEVIKKEHTALLVGASPATVDCSPCGGTVSPDLGIN